ncbi:hypothetical protein NONI108955_40855 [Nocardia ninae]
MGASLSRLRRRRTDVTTRMLLWRHATIRAVGSGLARASVVRATTVIACGGGTLVRARGVFRCDAGATLGSALLAAAVRTAILRTAPAVALLCSAVASTLALLSSTVVLLRSAVAATLRAVGAARRSIVRALRRGRVGGRTPGRGTITGRRSRRRAVIGAARVASRVVARATRSTIASAGARAVATGPTRSTALRTTDLRTTRTVGAQPICPGGLNAGRVRSGTDTGRFERAERADPWHADRIYPYPTAPIRGRAEVAVR